MFYNFGVTPWSLVTVGLQVISLALGGSPVVLLGLRGQF